MTTETEHNLLDELGDQIDESVDDLDDDRRMYFEGVVHLKEGRVAEAGQVFRRAARRCEPPFSAMATLAYARCEAVRGRQGSALRLFRTFADGDQPDGLRRMAWMEIADLARERGNDSLAEEARTSIAQLTNSGES